jgi:hypothetical protein
VSAIPWWGLPLIAVLFALAGAAVALLATARRGYGRPGRWYDERKHSYVALMTVFERAFYRIRTMLAAGQAPDPLAYVDEVGPALMQVRLLASGPVRSAALAVHKLLEQLYGGLKPAPVPGVEPEKHVRELLVQVPLVMQQFEAAVRDELGISTTPPRQTDRVEPDLRTRARALLRR